MSLSSELLVLEEEIISINNEASDFTGGFTGWPDDQVFDVSVTVTTPDQLKSEAELWRNGPVAEKKEIVCDWDGPLDMTLKTIRGFSSSKLTPNPDVFGGYERPEGGLLIRAAAGAAMVQIKMHGAHCRNSNSSS